MDRSATSIAAADVSIVVPIGGVSHAWPRAAASLAALDPRPGEIIAVVDGADVAAAATASAIGATVIVLEQRGGPARARNAGTRAARGAVLLFVDADIEASPDLAAHVARLFSAHPDVAAVIGSYDDSPSDAGFVSQYRNLLHHFVHQTARNEASTFWAGCGAVRRGAFDGVGGFNERFDDPSIEDIELGTRLIRAGHAIRLDKSLQVKHLKAWRLRHMLATDLWRRAVPWTELMLREGAMVNDLNVKTSDRISVALALVLLLALAGTWRAPMLLAVCVVVLVALVAINRRLFGFFLRRRGVWFAIGSVPLYWLYLLVSGYGFLIATVRHVSGQATRNGDRRTQ